ncbi:MAG: hypothetical protein ACJ8G1_10930 [Vitreoscilla sp.]
MLATIGCAWLGAPVVARLWSPTQSLQQLAAIPLYALFGVVQIILLACVVGSFRRRPWVAKVLRWCAIGWTVAVPAWVAMSPLGLMSLLMLPSPPGIVGSSTPATAAVAAPMHYALMALIALWAIALLAPPWPPAGQQRQPQEAARTPPARWERSVVWAGIVAAAVHVTIWPALQRSALSGALFHRNGAPLQVAITPEQWQALSAADQRTLLELNEDLALISKGQPPAHAQTVEYKNSTWYRTRWYEIATFRSQGRVRQVNVIFYGDLRRVAPEPVFFVDWPVRRGASDAASVAG